MKFISCKNVQGLQIIFSPLAVEFFEETDNNKTIIHFDSGKTLKIDGTFAEVQNTLEKHWK